MFIKIDWTILVSYKKEKTNNGYKEREAKIKKINILEIIQIFNKITLPSKK